MSTPAEHRHAWLNTDRHRTPRILIIATSPSSFGVGLSLIFDRDMDTVTPLDAAFRVRAYNPDNDQWYEYSTAGSSWANARTLNLAAPTSTGGGYTGADAFVRYMRGNLRDKGRWHPMLWGERCDRIEASGPVAIFATIDYDTGGPGVHSVFVTFDRPVATNGFQASDIETHVNFVTNGVYTDGVGVGPASPSAGVIYQTNEGSFFPTGVPDAKVVWGGTDGPIMFQDGSTLMSFECPLSEA